MKSLCLPAILDSLEEIGNYIIEAAGSAGLDAKAAYGLRLAVDEIATNIITHGYEEAGGSGDINIFGEISPEALTITLEDTAIPFNPLSMALPGKDELSLPLEEREIGGLGLFLVLKSVDKFSYEFSEGKNRNIFVKNRPEEVNRGGADSC